MNSKAEEDLRRRVISNYSDKNYPTMPPLTNTLKKHIEIYKLIDEYNSLVTDMVNASSSTVALIRPRLNEIEEALLNYWIVTDEELVKPRVETPTEPKKKGKSTKN